MDASVSRDTGGTFRLLIPWLCLGASMGFLLWTVFSSPDELQQVAVGLRRYMFSLPAGLAAAGALCALLRLAGAWRVAERLGYVSGVLYLGFLKTLGWGFVPWALIAVMVFGFVRTKELSIESRWSLILLHVMGTTTGLYMAFQLNEFLRAWNPFRDVLESLWLLTIELISRLT